MKNYFWFRRDLRLFDNKGLYKALTSGLPVQCIFVFDKNILDRLDDKKDARVQFIYDRLILLNAELVKFGSGLQIEVGNPIEIWKKILSVEPVQSVFVNHDYEPYAIKRDTRIKALLSSSDVTFYSFKDHVIFEKREVAKNDGLPYTVFTPYKKKWLQKFQELKLPQNYPSQKFLDNTVKTNKTVQISLRDIGFEKSEVSIPSKKIFSKLVSDYDKTRDYPSIKGTSRLGIHFRFGTISIREKVRKAALLNDVFLSELIWRDFYAQILFNFPHVADRSFREKYDKIEWRNDETEFQLWCQGETGYPLVDAGMRELNATGFMHNRVRMLTASFLTKHLLIDWRWGELYFAGKLLDYDLASNNGGWQWAAGCGTDAAPYFRIFNPMIQHKKFDPKDVYVNKWVLEYGTEDYAQPIVDHKEARERCLRTYKEALT